MSDIGPDIPQQPQLPDQGGGDAGGYGDNSGGYDSDASGYGEDPNGYGATSEGYANTSDADEADRVGYGQHADFTDVANDTSGNTDLADYGGLTRDEEVRLYEGLEPGPEHTDSAGPEEFEAEDRAYGAEHADAGDKPERLVDTPGDALEPTPRASIEQVAAALIDRIGAAFERDFDDAGTADNNVLNDRAPSETTDTHVLSDAVPQEIAQPEGSIEPRDIDGPGTDLVPTQPTDIKGINTMSSPDEIRAAYRKFVEDTGTNPFPELLDSGTNAPAPAAATGSEVEPRQSRVEPRQSRNETDSKDTEPQPAANSSAGQEVNPWVSPDNRGSEVEPYKPPATPETKATDTTAVDNSAAADQPDYGPRPAASETRETQPMSSTSDAPAGNAPNQREDIPSAAADQKPDVPPPHDPPPVNTPDAPAADTPGNPFNGNFNDAPSETDTGDTAGAGDTPFTPQDSEIMFHPRPSVLNGDYTVNGEVPIDTPTETPTDIPVGRSTKMHVPTEEERMEALRREWRNSQTPAEMLKALDDQMGTTEKILTNTASLASAISKPFRSIFSGAAADVTPVSAEPAKFLGLKVPGRYKVKTDSGVYVTVNADSVREAMQQVNQFGWASMKAGWKTKMGIKPNVRANSKR